MADTAKRTSVQMRTRQRLIDHIALLVAQTLPCKTIADQILEYIAKDVISPDLGPFICGRNGPVGDDGCPERLFVSPEYGASIYVTYKKDRPNEVGI